MEHGWKHSQRRGRFVAGAAVAVWLTASLIAAATASANPSTDSRPAERLLTNLPAPGVECSAYAVDLGTGEDLCNVNPTSAMLPASTAKLLVMAAAIDLLGSDFAFRTVLATRGPDLLLVGDGDPGFGDEKVAQMRGEQPTAVLDRWADALRQAGVTRIQGDLIFDDTIFDQQFIHPGWEERDLKKWFAAPVGGLNFNDNCIDITLRPAAQSGAPPLWESVPRTGLIELVNRCKSGGNGQAIIDRPEPSFQFVVTGRCPKVWPFPPIPAPEPSLLTADVVRTGLADRGITVNGQVRRHRVRLPGGQLPNDVRVIADHVTPLPLVLTRIGKDSQNMFAEALCKRIGFEWARRQGYADPQGSWDTGRSALEAFLAKAGVDSRNVTVADASGLSRQNRISAADLVKVLVYMDRHPGRDLYIESLSEAGKDGTLRKRLKDLPGEVHGKTGLMHGVRTLSGYAITPTGRRRAFAVCFNGFKGRTAPYNELHDKVCRILATDPPG